MIILNSTMTEDIDDFIIVEKSDEPELRDYQVADLSYYYADPKCMNLSDPGTGKTASVVVKQGDRWRSGGMASVWSQPKSLLQKNKEEIHMFNPDLDDDEVVIFDGANVKRHEGRKDVAVWLMGPDRFKRCYKDLPSNIGAHDCDEFHMLFGGSTSARTLAYLDYHRGMDEGIVMTGTLIHGRIDTVFPAIHAIEPRYYSGYDSFLAHHAYLDEYGRPYGWKNHDRIAQILSRHAIRHTFAEVYGEESKVIIPEDADMSTKQRTIYDEFMETLTIDLGDAIIDGSAAPMTILRGRQIMETAFAMNDPRGEEFPKVDLLDGKLAGKEELLELHFADHARSGEPVVVFATFVSQQNRILELANKAGLRAAIMNGKVSAKQRAAIDLAFRQGQLDCLICTPMVAAFGYNWQFWGPNNIEVDHCIFASMDFLDTSFLQAYRRFIRGKRSRPLRITILRYRNSMDQRVFEIIRTKSKDANKVDRSRQIYRFNDNTEEIDMVI
jgi:hypothetical protein